MQLARNEQDLLAEVAAIVRTPRGVKKLVNLYRLVRVGPQAVADPKFAAPEVGAGNAVALLLAAVVGMPKVATRVLTALAVAPNRSTLTEVLDDAASHVIAVMTTQTMTVRSGVTCVLTLTGYVRRSRGW